MLSPVPTSPEKPPDLGTKWLGTSLVRRHRIFLGARNRLLCPSLLGLKALFTFSEKVAFLIPTRGSMLRQGLKSPVEVGAPFLMPYPWPYWNPWGFPPTSSSSQFLLPPNPWADINIALRKRLETLLLVPTLLLSKLACQSLLWRRLKRLYLSHLCKPPQHHQLRQ